MEHDETAEGQVLEKASETIMLLQGDRNDGNVAVRFSPDDLEAWGDFYPPLGAGKPLKADFVADALARLRVVHGLLWENIQDTVSQCNLEHKIIKGVQIARGDPPVQEVLEYFETNPNLHLPPSDQTKDAARIDYRSISPFVIVKKGQILARLRPRKEGRDGKNIRGDSINHTTLKPEGVSGGENTKGDGKFIYAEINGQFLEERGVLRVQNSLNIKGAVDYHTGHIVFPGDISIEGPVSDGFKIYSGGSITIKQTFDVTDAIAKTDLTVSGGIIGRGRALVKVGGELKTKFIENCKVACRKTINVEADIVNSSVYTMERIEMGEKGTILGGDIYAVHGIKAGALGKKSGKATTIHCGIDFTALQEKERQNYNLRIVNAKMAKLKELLEAEQKPEKKAKMEEAINHLGEDQKKISAAISSILGRLNSDEAASVEVLGDIASGTLIEICQIALFVTEPLHHVRVRLDRALGK
ncbi:MAG: FapA family protein, partial [Spirochaetales bacterium]|nr:FapA family protein [Spirochaetales bacterium]